jgi:hypothetical protein
MHLQMVKFMAHEGDIPTGGKADQMLEKANALWNPGHIFFEDLHTPQPIISASLKTQPHYEKLYDIRPNKNVDKLISVFFVAYDLDCSGGGYTPEGFTVNALHAQAAIVISESAKSEFVLAHELGHVLGGLHPPLGAPSSGQWYGDNDTILAEFPFPKRNSRRNCLLAASPALEKTNTSVALCIESVAWSVDE